MNKIKQIRTSLNFTQKHLAELMRTTQQTIARWETGKAEPNLAALRDMAMIFQCGVDDILGTHPFSRKPATNWFAVGDRDGFWGHLGLNLEGEAKARWYPITLSTADSIGRAMGRQNSDFEWVFATTLNNRALLIRPTAVNRVWLLDDACDEPEGDPFEFEGEYEGSPLEFYAALGRWADGDLEDEEDEENSERLIATVANYVKEHGLNPEDVGKRLRHTSIHYANGGAVSYWAEPRDLSELIEWVELEQVDPMFKISAMGGDFESYYPAQKLSLVEMPLTELIGHVKDSGGEEEDEDEDDE